MFAELFTPEQLTILTQIILIDLVLAGDNAIIIGMVASKFPLEQRRKIIIFGIGGALIAIVGANVGAKKFSRAISMTWKGTFFSVFIVGFIGLFHLLLLRFWHIITTHPKVFLYVSCHHVCLM